MTSGSWLTRTMSFRRAWRYVSIELAVVTERSRRLATARSTRRVRVVEVSARLVERTGSTAITRRTVKSPRPRRRKDRGAVPALSLGRLAAAACFTGREVYLLFRGG